MRTIGIVPIYERRQFLLATSKEYLTKVGECDGGELMQELSQRIGLHCNMVKPYLKSFVLGGELIELPNWRFKLPQE